MEIKQLSNEKATTKTRSKNKNKTKKKKKNTKTNKQTAEHSKTQLKNLLTLTKWLQQKQSKRARCK